MPVNNDTFGNMNYIPGGSGTGSFWDGWDELMKLSKNGGTQSGPDPLVGWDNQGKVLFGDPGRIPNTDTPNANAFGGSSAGYNTTTLPNGQVMLMDKPIDYSKGLWGPNGQKAPDGWYYGSDGTTHVLNAAGQRALDSGGYWHPDNWSAQGNLVGPQPDLKTKFYNRLYQDHQAADGSGLTADYLKGVAGELGTDVYSLGSQVFGKDHGQVDSFLAGLGKPTTTGGSSGGGSGGGGSTSPGTGYEMPTLDTSYKQNPYLDEQAAGITRNAVDTWTRSIAPSLRSGAMAAGGFGSSRQKGAAIWNMISKLF